MLIPSQTTVAKRVVHHDSLDFPAISICPGYRNLVRELEWPLLSVKTFGRGLNDTKAGENYPRSREEAEKLWDDITYGAEDTYLPRFWTMPKLSPETH